MARPNEPALIEVHEDRIRDLESGISDVSGQLRVQEQRFVYLNEKVGDLDDKVEMGVREILQEMKSVSTKLDDQAKASLLLTTRVGSLEGVNDKITETKKGRKVWIRATIGSLVTTGLAGLVKMLFFPS